VVATADRGASRRRQRAGLAALFLAPAESAIEAEGVRAIEIDYPPLHLALAGWRLHWLVVFLVTSLATALPFRRRLGVEL
jgi:hypothetical protein